MMELSSANAKVTLDEITGNLRIVPRVFMVVILSFASLIYDLFCAVKAVRIFRCDIGCVLCLHRHGRGSSFLVL